MIAGIDEMIRILARFFAKPIAWKRCRITSAKASMTRPYPTSPTMIPKKSGKKMARIGVGSTSRYRGGATSCMMNSKGLTHGGLS